MEKGDCGIYQCAGLKGKNMTINELVSRAHENAVRHGFWDKPPEFGTAIALIHSELSEALEEHREGKNAYYVEIGKPEGYAVELADAVIRIADLCGALGIDLEEAIAKKMKYNESRPYRHGKKY